MSFAEISKFLRKEKNISQMQLANALNLSNGCIAMIEIGKNEPTANTLLKYADFFQCSTDYLLGREDDFGNITIQTEKPAPLPQDEQEFLTMYRALPSYLKDSIFSELKGMYKAYLASKSEKTTRRA